MYKTKGVAKYIVYLLSESSVAKNVFKAVNYVATMLVTIMQLLPDAPASDIIDKITLDSNSCRINCRKELFRTSVHVHKCS